MREDVKDLLQRAAGWYEPPPIRPEELARRVSRQRRRGRIVAGTVALAVFAAAGTFTWKAFQPSSAVGPTQPGTNATATVHGVSVTFPGSWTLVDLWPLAKSIASWPEPVGTSINIPEETPARGGLPLLQISNQDLGLRSACGAEVTGGEAVLYVALNGGPYQVNPDGSPIWSHQLSEGEGPCGGGWYAYKASSEPGGGGTTLSTPYLIFAGFGPAVSKADRDAVFRAFDSLTLAPFDDLRPPAEASPTYVAPEPETSSPPTTSDVLRMTCGLTGRPVVQTPIVKAQADGVHVLVEDLAGSKAVLFRQRSRPQVGWSSGSNGLDAEFVTLVPPGETFVSCMGQDGTVDIPAGAPLQGDETAFTVVDPDGAWVPTDLACGFSDRWSFRVSTAQPTDNGMTPSEAAAALVPGIKHADSVEPAGYVAAETQTDLVRAVRNGKVVAWLMAHAALASWSFDGYACPRSGIG